jgi:formylglycine-generating enzyme required for sulfatase activity
LLREQQFRVTVTTPPRLRLLPVGDITLEAGRSRKVTVQVERHKVAGAVTLTLSGLPAGVRAPPARIDAGSSRGEVELTAALDAGGSRHVTLRVASGDLHDEQDFTLLVKAVEPSLKNSIGLELVLIPAGKFAMGSPRNEAGRYPDEEQHEVEITQPFYLGKYAVTRGQFRKFVEATGHRTEAEKDGLGGSGYDAERRVFLTPTYDRETRRFKAPGTRYTWRDTGFEQTDEHPVVNVSWNDAVAFCAWLGNKEGKSYRLPTEAEWEYSCRARTTTRFYCGDAGDGLKAVANLADLSLRPKVDAEYARSWIFFQAWDDGYPFTAPVGQFQPNAFGLYDMHGNVWQWCADWYGADYYKHSPRQDPQGPASGAFRALRGGSFLYDPRTVRSAFRNDFRVPSFRWCDFGFRVVRER